MLDDLTPEEVTAIVHLMSNVQGNEMVFVGNVMHKLESIPGMETLAQKVSEAGDREDVKAYVEATYGKDEEGEEENENS